MPCYIPVPIHSDRVYVWTNQRLLVTLGDRLSPTAGKWWRSADFKGDGYPDYLLYNAATRQTAIWYLNNNVDTGSAFGPTLPAAGAWPRRE